MLREGGKVAAFFRRDLLVAWSYRAGFVTDLAGLLAQALLFWFVGRMIDTNRLPQFAGAPTSYLAFVTVGIVVNAFLQLGMGRMRSAIRNEQLRGTLESVLITPTSATTLQLGLVIYDLVHLTVEMLIFLALVAVLFGVHLATGGLAPAVVTILVFIPFTWGLGALSAATTLTFRELTAVWGYLGAGLAVGSGAFFPLDLLPAWMAAIAHYSPVAIALDSARAALLGGASWHQVAPLLMWLAPMSAVTLAAGLAAFQLALRRERRLGTLGLY
jgi:ABC-type polysaccharide/polyol phosphate export permease